MGNGQPTIKPVVATGDQQPQGAGPDSAILPTIEMQESTGRSWPPRAARSGSRTCPEHAVASGESLPPAGQFLMPFH